MLFGVPAEAAYDYLADPRNRPAWQSSLARVELLNGAAVRPGQRWVDVTGVGVRPVMETVEARRPHRWSERGTWRGLVADLTLVFEEDPRGCLVRPSFRLAGSGAWRPLAWVLSRAAGPAVRSDLRRAAAALSNPTDR